MDPNSPQFWGPHWALYPRGDPKTFRYRLHKPLTQETYPTASFSRLPPSVQPVQGTSPLQDPSGPWALPSDLSDPGLPLVTKVMVNHNHGETIKHQSESDPQIQASQAVASEIIRTLSHVSHSMIQYWTYSIEL